MSAPSNQEVDLMLVEASIFISEFLPQEELIPFS